MKLEILDAPPPPPPPKQYVLTLTEDEAKDIRMALDTVGCSSLLCNDQIRLGPGALERRNNMRILKNVLAVAGCPMWWH